MQHQPTYLIENAKKHGGLHMSARLRRISYLVTTQQ